MNNRSIKIIGLAFIGMILSFSSCIKDDFDIPPVFIPQVDFDSNISIDSLKIMFPGVLSLIDTDLIIQGRIVATDESGNFYKTMELQDATGGLELKIDKTNLYTEYKLGQRVFIKCKGLYIGQYGGMTQLGYIYNGSIGRLPEVYIKDHYFKDSLPGPLPHPDTLLIPQLTPKYLSTVITFKNIHFVEPGQMYAPQTADYTNRTMVDDNNNTLILRTSKYANFASNVLPKGKGSVSGILSVYNGEYQFYIRDLNDIAEFDTTAQFETTILEENFDVDPAGWVSYSVASNKDWYWSSTYQAMVANGYGGDVASNDWLISPAIDLGGVTDPLLSFRTWTKYTDGGLATPLEVLISTNYSGNPSTASWQPLGGTLPAANSSSWTASGDVDLSAYPQTVRIAFHYRTSGTANGSTSQWEVDAFKVRGVK